MRTVRHVTLAVLTSVLLTLGGTPAGAQETEPDPAQLELGRALYERNCSSCHGPEGAGTRFGASLVDLALDTGFEDNVVVVAEGRGAGMPAFGGSLDDDEINAVVTFVRAEWSTEIEEGELDEAELAVTGPGHSTELAIVGIAMLAAGSLVFGFARSIRPEV